MGYLKHLGHMFSDILEGDVFKFGVALRALGSVYFQIQPFAMSTGAG